MREKEQAEKARRITAAISKILARKGYAEATISQIASEAGVSRGLLHYYFKNKEEMLAQTVRDNAEISLHLINDLFAGAPSLEDMARGVLTGLERIAHGDPGFIYLMLESWAVSRRSEVVAAEVRSNYREFRKAATLELKKAQDQGRISSRIPAEPLALALIGLFDGLGLQLLMEPDLSARSEIVTGIEKAVLALLG